MRVPPPSWEAGGGVRQLRRRLVRSGLYHVFMTRTKLGATRSRPPRTFERAIQQELASFERRERQWLVDDWNVRARRLAASIALAGLDSLRST